MKHDYPIIGQESPATLDHLEQPVGAFDAKTLGFLFLNRAGQDWLGYGEDELASMTMADILQQQDRDAIRRAATETPEDTGNWRIVTKSGDLREAALVWRQVRFRDRDALLVTFRDVTDLQAARREIAALAFENTALRESGGPAIEQVRVLLEAVPGQILVLRPGSYEILAASDAYTQATMTRRQDLLGSALPDIFPDDPDDPTAAGVRRMRASLRRVEVLQVPDAMGVLRHPVRHPDGKVEERYWIMLNVPVPAPTGELAYLIHRVEDVTALVRKGAPDKTHPVDKLAADRLSAELMARFGDVPDVLARLHEEQVQREAAARLLHVGMLEYDPASGALNWSDPVLDLFGIPKDGPVPDFEGYIRLVHPDDKDRITRLFEDFLKTGETHLDVEHRILRPDSSVAHIRSVGERQNRKGSEVVIAFVQDITNYVATKRSPSLADNLLKLAGEKVQLGGWRVEIGSMN